MLNLVGIAVTGHHSHKAVKWVRLPLNKPKSLRLIASKEAEVQRNQHVIDAHKIALHCLNSIKEKSTVKEACLAHMPEWCKWNLANANIQKWVAKVCKELLALCNKYKQQGKQAQTLAGMLTGLHGKDDDSDDKEDSEDDLDGVIATHLSSLQTL